jgi:hypothetical protein
MPDPELAALIEQEMPAAPVAPAPAS